MASKKDILSGDGPVCNIAKTGNQSNIHCWVAPFVDARLRSCSDLFDLAPSYHWQRLRSARRHTFEASRTYGAVEPLMSRMRISCPLTSTGSPSLHVQSRHSDFSEQARKPTRLCVAEANRTALYPAEVLRWGMSKRKRASISGSPSCRWRGWQDSNPRPLGS